MSFTIQTDHAGFRKMAGEFFKLGEGATFEELDHGLKALTLAYLSLPPPTPVQEVEQVAIMRLAGKAVLQAEMRQA
jgi:hypothetical protein